MPYRIPSSTKLFTLPTAPFLFLLVVVLCLSVNLLWCQMCTFYCSLMKKRCTLLSKGTDVHIQQHIYQRDLHLCLQLYYYGKVIVELGKTQTRNLTVLMVLVIWPSSTLEFLFFWFQLNSLSNLFLKFGKFLVLYLGCGCMKFQNIDDFTSSLSYAHE